MGQYNYEAHTWGGSINRKGLDFPRMKFDIIIKTLSSVSAQNILEVGCGAGKFIFSLAKDYPAAYITGVDISKQAIDAAVKNNQNPHLLFICADAENLHFPEQSFDVILFLDVLEHLEKPGKTVADCCKFLKPGGIMHAFVPCEAHSVYWIGERILGFHSKERTAGHIQRFKRSDAVALFSGVMQVTDKKYSFHLLGSIMDYILFTLLLNKKVNNIFWRDNKFYNKKGKISFAGSGMNLLLSIGTAIAYLESFLLQRVQFTATGIHITAKKNQS